MQASTPCAWCSRPRACSRTLVLAGPQSSAARTISAGGTPAIAPACSGVYGSTASTTASQPLVWAAMKARSIQPRWIITRSMPFSTPMSPPGFTGTKRSAVRARGVTRGSRTMIFAPCSRARQR